MNIKDDCLHVEEEIIQQQQLMEHDFGRLLIHALSYLDVVTLLQKQVVSKQFKELCTKAISMKCGNDGPKPLTNSTLREAVVKFCDIMYKEGSNKEDMEEIACTYGFPIDSWNVSQLTNMSELFCGDQNYDYSELHFDPSEFVEMDSVTHFNAFIGSWDTSNVTTMNCMFCSAYAFNQDIGRWDVSKVTDMKNMFRNCKPFNQYIGG
ncbi:fibronectin domain containing protein [Nitzschia inconspicua]|uniref:Fibronectin domain containing protein n=1 Tax=Nitzschia inconspicua TaxID=303405 RepID=A0A9K3PSM5_9STRA|nr:fibronectin domain containing protein [Nitzschia inconspicua]